MPIYTPIVQIRISEARNNLKVQWGESAENWYKTYMRFDIGTGPHSFTDASLDFLLTYFANYLDSTHMLSVYGVRDGDAGENWGRVYDYVEQRSSPMFQQLVINCNRNE